MPQITFIVSPCRPPWSFACASTHFPEMSRCDIGVVCVCTTFLNLSMHLLTPFDVLQLQLIRARLLSSGKGGRAPLPLRLRF